MREIVKRKEEFLPFIQGDANDDHLTIGQYCRRMISVCNELFSALYVIINKFKQKATKLGRKCRITSNFPLL